MDSRGEPLVTEAEPRELAALAQVLGEVVQRIGVALAPQFGVASLPPSSLAICGRLGLRGREPPLEFGVGVASQRTSSSVMRSVCRSLECTQPVLRGRPAKLAEDPAEAVSFGR